MKLALVALSFNIGFILTAAALVKNSEMVPVLRETVKRCDEFPTPAALDYSNFELTYLNDSHTYVNGSIRFTKPIAKPWKLRVTAAQFIRSHWLTQGFDRTYEDFCFSAHNPAEPAYQYTKDYPECPIEPGSEVHYDSILFKLPDGLMKLVPDYYAGAWRFKFMYETIINEEKVIDCVYFYADVFEIQNGKW